MKLIKYSLFTLFFVVALSSCSKEKENVQPEPETPACKLLSMKISTAPERVVVYDALGRPIQFEGVQYIYNTRNQLVERRQESSTNVNGQKTYSVTKYTWQGNVLVESVITSPENQPRVKITNKFTANSKGQIIATSYKEEDFIKNTTIIAEAGFEYNAAGNVQKVTNKGANYTHVTEFTYDNKKGPQEFYKMIAPDALAYFSKNNVLIVKYDGKTQTEFSYVYNEKGYAINKKLANGSPSDISETYNYECK